MSIKKRLLCGTIFALGSISMQKANAKIPALDAKKDSTEYVTKNLKDTTLNKQNAPLAPSTVQMSEILNEDSLILAKKEANFANAEKLMFYLIANFEGFRSQAYRLSYKQRGRRVTEKFYTYNFGNTITADGDAVKSTDRITNFDESYNCYDAFIKTPTKQNPVPLKEAMMLSLPIDKMEDFDIAVLAEIGYNYGPGLFVNKKTKEPTQFAKLASTYFNNKTPENLEKFGKSFLARCTANHRVHPVLRDRRQVAFNILKGKIIIYIDENAISHLPPEKQKIAVNLQTHILGVLNGAQGNPEKIQQRLESGAYICESGDSIQHAIEEDLIKSQKKKNINLAMYKQYKARRGK